MATIKRTIEEKAKAYDEAIERARYWEKNPTVWSSDDICQKLFPELKESEDERMRNAAIKACKYMVDNFENSTKDYEDAIAWLEKQGKPKPTDKVEPKFKVGDWVVYDHRAYQVVELPKEGYINLGLRRNGKIEFAPSTYCRLWTIQDAKAGDVLAYRDGQWIFIYKEKIDDSSFYYHTLYSTIHQDLTINDAGFTLLGDAIIPATKEQRDLLFRKMKEAGYEWDAEKKELKKISQRMVSAEAKEAMYDKPAWSKEDEKIANSIWDSIDKSVLTNYGVDEDKAFEWLSHIKDRVQLQPKQEWSEEDERIYNRICDIIHNAAFANYDVDEDGKELGEYAKIIGWLKSLKPQTTWKPSEEQIDALEDAIADAVSSIQKNMLNSLYQDLKKLREE